MAKDLTHFSVQRWKVRARRSSHCSVHDPGCLTSLAPPSPLLPPPAGISMPACICARTPLACCLWTLWSAWPAPCCFTPTSSHRCCSPACCWRPRCRTWGKVMGGRHVKARTKWDRDSLRSPLRKHLQSHEKKELAAACWEKVHDSSDSLQASDVSEWKCTTAADSVNVFIALQFKNPRSVFVLYSKCKTFCIGPYLILNPPTWQ